MIVRNCRFFATVIVFAGLPLAGSCAQGDPPDPAVAPFVSVNAKVVAVTHVRVIDGTGHDATPDQTVVFSNGKIAAVGPAAATLVPGGAIAIDGTGKTLLPGYVGAHNHLFTGIEAGERHLWRSMPFSFPRLYLAAGTTTIRTTGSMDIYADLHTKQSIDAGQGIGPDMDVTSPYLTGPGNYDPQMDELGGPEDGRATVDFWAAHGVTSFKVYTYITRDTLAAVIDEAHKQNLKVMGHLCSIGYHEAAALGIDEFEHGPYFTDTDFEPPNANDACPSNRERTTANAKIVPGGPEISALIKELVAKHIPVSSTLPLYESLGLEPADVLAPSLALMDPDQKKSVEQDWERLKDPKTYTAPSFAKYPNYLRDVRTNFNNEMAFELRFARAGGLLTCGPDPSGYGAVIAGLGDWRELELLVRAGFKPVEAIHVATQNGSIALGREQTVGTISVGKNADAILVDGDPSTNIADIERVETVFKNGTGYDSKKIFESVKGFVGRI